MTLTRQKVRAAILSKHAGPIHPGTGTDQSVHGGGRKKLTLYRGEGSLDHPSYYTEQSGDAGGYWTTDIESARRYASGVPEGKVYEIEVDESEVERRGLYQFISDPEVRARRRLHGSPPRSTDPELQSQAAYNSYRFARWLDEGNEGPAHDAINWFVDRGTTVTDSDDPISREAARYSLMESWRAAKDLEARGIGVLPERIVFAGGESMGNRLMSTTHTGVISINTGLQHTARHDTKPRRHPQFKFGSSTAYDSFTHEIGHVLDVKSDRIHGARLYETYGPFEDSVYGNFDYDTLGREYAPLVDKLSNRAEYPAEAFFAAVTDRDDVPTELKDLMLEEARKYAAPSNLVTKADIPDLCPFGLSEIEWLVHRVEKHAAPIHPGTGTDQSVHGHGGTGNKPSLSDVTTTMSHTTSGKSRQEDPRYDPMTFDYGDEIRRAWHSLPELTGDRVYWTRPEKLDGLQKELDRLNRRGSRYLGITDPLSISQLPRTHAHTMSDGRQVNFIAIQLEGSPPYAPGFEFIGKLEHLPNEDGSYTNILKTVPGHEGEIPPKYRTAGPACEVCNRNIYRKETFLVKEISTGKIIQAGRDDLAIYTGFTEADQLANYTSSYADFVAKLEGSDADFEGGGGGGALTWNARDAIAVTASVTRHEGFTPTSRRGEATPTKDTVAELLSRGRVPEEMKHLLPQEQDYAKAEEVIDWLSGLEDEDLSDYMWNLKVAATNPLGVDERQLGIIASSVNAHDRELGRIVERETRVNLDAESDWVGTVKERRDFNDITVSRVNSFEGMYGTTYVYEFLDADNNNLVWFASNPLERQVPKEMPQWAKDQGYSPDEFYDSIPLRPGDQLDLKATIKEHKTDTYNNRNRKQTVITRGKASNVRSQQS